MMQWKNPVLFSREVSYDKQKEMAGAYGDSVLGVQRLRIGGSQGVYDHVDGRKGGGYGVY